MLVGVGGSGKQSLTRFAAHISGCKVVQVELSRNYGLTEFRADLVKLYRTAGVDNEQVVFLFSDTSIVQESFLEDINNMLNSGGSRCVCVLLVLAYTFDPCSYLLAVEACNSLCSMPFHVVHFDHNVGAMVF
jgi:hypothetical protein